MGDERILPPPPSSAARLRIPSTETDFWAGLFLDLSVRVEWLGQALDAVPKEDASAASLVRMRSYARSLAELHEAIGKVHACRAEATLKPLFSLEGTLANYLSCLYGWCEGIGDDFERMAIALRRKEPTSIVFHHRSVNESYAKFDELIVAMRHANHVAHELHAAKSPQVWRAFDERVEELIWATEWVHMTLARKPGE